MTIAIAIAQETAWARLHIGMARDNIRGAVFTGYDAAIARGILKELREDQRAIGEMITALEAQVGTEGAYHDCAA